MSKALAMIDPKAVEAVKTQALSLLKESFTQARDRGDANGAATPPLFPNGVELIRVKFEVAVGEFAKAAVEVEVAGPKAPSAS